MRRQFSISPAYENGQASPQHRACACRPRDARKYQTDGHFTLLRADRLIGLPAVVRQQTGYPARGRDFVFF